MKVKKGDDVVVLAGKDVGRRGTITRVINETDKVIVDGVNMVKRHTKPQGQVMQGGIIDKEMPIHVSNVGAVVQGMRRDPHRLPLRRRRREAPRSAASAEATSDGRDHHAPAPRLKQRFETELKPQLQTELGLTNVMQVPQPVKIVVNMGVGRATQQRSLLDGAVTDLTIITGQKPLVTKAKKSIASFKLREGNEIGAKVTLRGDRMWEFYDRLVSLAIPRIRDFRGMPPKQFDGHGNYTFGLTEQLVFPEIDYDKIDSVRGMNVTIVTTAETDDQGRALLRVLGFPFRRDGQG